MNKYIIGSTSLRMTFLFIAAMMWLGIWLTGLKDVHWLLYIPATLLTFAGGTGICPGLIVNKKIFSEFSL